MSREKLRLHEKQCVTRERVDGAEGGWGGDAVAMLVGYDGGNTVLVGESGETFVVKEGEDQQAAASVGIEEGSAG